MVVVASSCHGDKDPDPSCQEQPRNDSGCYHIYHPVCGCNGKTYSNECEAFAHGITSYQNGECSGSK
ncbi:Kazal-type serine protease inhibitor domain-containing protein [Dyadobacter endophyticus]|uniref:Kazal-type serine protease inhibitor domain-containing protein n=1 Tax=Dyadobacter endophyticus TaxID=1749036 RepID=UPI001666BB4B|nr:Kazal-type serine protease inhibitor domain-containing protein [Dyadobacter endophyticus]